MPGGPPVAPPSSETREGLDDVRRALIDGRLAGRSVGNYEVDPENPAMGPTMLTAELPDDVQYSPVSDREDDSPNLDNVGRQYPLCTSTLRICNGEGYAMVTCRTCNEIMCVRCMRAHNNTPSTNEHLVDAPRCTSLFKECQRSGNTVSRAYCVACMSFLCLECMTKHDTFTGGTHHSSVLLIPAAARQPQPAPRRPYGPMSEATCTSQFDNDYCTGIAMCTCTTCGSSLCQGCEYQHRHHFEDIPGHTPRAASCNLSIGACVANGIPNTEADSWCRICSEFMCTECCRTHNAFHPTGRHPGADLFNWQEYDYYTDMFAHLLGHETDAADAAAKVLADDAAAAQQDMLRAAAAGQHAVGEEDLEILAGLVARNAAALARGGDEGGSATSSGVEMPEPLVQERAAAQSNAGDHQTVSETQDEATRWSPVSDDPTTTDEPPTKKRRPDSA
jgi:hypothetical protein